MPSINLLDPSLGIQAIMESPAAARGGIPEARPLAANVLREAGVEELYSPSNAHRLVEQAPPGCGRRRHPPPGGVFRQPRGIAWSLQGFRRSAVRALVDGALPCCFKTRNSSTPDMGLMIGG